MSIEIELTQGQRAIVCECHYHLVARHKWYAKWSETTKSFYACSNATTLFGRKTIRMHRLVNNTPKGMDTDHENRNTLDNRCSNLKNATRAQNRRNTGLQANNASGFKGVHFHKKNKKWVAESKINNKPHYLGSFDTAEQAARAYDEFVGESL